MLGLEFSDGYRMLRARADGACSGAYFKRRDGWKSSDQGGTGFPGRSQEAKSEWNGRIDRDHWHRWVGQALAGSQWS